ncbi:MAG TPA: hypothetical protein VFV38_26655 [Ktedonobacteraceae bacterium]|nr:hypothetical protein [Ktedonobacteraceae bacterium]
MSKRKSQPAPAWLEDSVYEPKRKHSVDLVKQSVDTLVTQRKQGSKTRISLATIVATSKQLDPTGVGVAHTTILENAEAYAYYKKYRTTSPKTVKRRSQRVSIDMSEPDIAQDPALTRRRQYYMTWRRAELVDELLRVQQERDRFQEQWLDASDNLLQWQLRALEAEKQ